MLGFDLLTLLASTSARKKPPAYNPPPIVQTPPPTMSFSPIQPSTTKTFVFAETAYWKVMVDPSLNNGCFIFGSWPNGTVLRLGFNPRDGVGYIMLANESWKSLHKGEQYQLKYTFGSNTPWYANSSVRQMDNGFIFLYTYFTKAEFITEFRSSNSVTVLWGPREIASLQLQDTAAAADKLQACQQLYGFNSADPFAQRPQVQDSAPTPRDPFS